MGSGSGNEGSADRHPATVYFELISLLGEFYGYDYHYCLHRLTLAQALALVTVKNERERKIHEASQATETDEYGERKYTSADHFKDFNKPEYDINDINQLPTMADLEAMFGSADLF